MMRRLLAAGILSLTCLAPAHAADVAGSTHLRWDRCFSDGGVQFRDFACDTNAGYDLLVGTFQLEADLPPVNTMEIHVSIGSASALLPEWWKSHPYNTGSCRIGGFSLEPALPAGSAGCEAWVDPALVSYNIALYERYSSDPNLARLRMINGTPNENARELLAGREYHAFSLQIRRQKTVGTGACGGCLEPVAIFLAAVEFTHLDNSSTLLWFGPEDSGDQWASWQQGYPTNRSHGCTMTGGGLFCLNPSVWFDVVPYSPTAARGNTWGQIKSMYR